MQQLKRLFRGAPAVLGGVMLLGAGLELADWAVFRLLRYRLAALYAVTGELRKGMPRDEVLRILDRNAAPYVSRRDLPDGNVTLWVHYGLVDSCSTAIGFRNGVVDRTWTIGEDSPTDYCPGAPADVR